MEAENPCVSRVSPKIAAAQGAAASPERLLQRSRYGSWKFNPKAVALVSQVFNPVCLDDRSLAQRPGKPHIPHPSGAQNSLALGGAQQMEVSTAEEGPVQQLRGQAAFIKVDQRVKRLYRYPRVLCTPVPIRPAPLSKGGGRTPWCPGPVL